MLSFITDQWHAIIAAESWLSFLVLLVLIGLTFYQVYRAKDLEFISLGLRRTSFDNEFYKKMFLWYLPWAAFQQLLVLFPLYDVPWSDWVRYGTSVATFTVLFHFGNWRLMCFAGLFSASAYYCWYHLDMYSLLHLALLHAFGGTLYYFTGWDMRVWRREQFADLITLLKRIGRCLKSK